jgi:cytochrome c
MKTSLIAALATLALAAPVFAGDAAEGEDNFKKCKACHMIVAPDGTEIYKGGKTGPNLYGIVGRQVASVEGFKYKDSIVAVGATGMVWDEAELAAYMADPKAWLIEKTGDAKAKSGMTHKQKDHQEDIAAYLASVAPAPEAAAQ